LLSEVFKSVKKKSNKKPPRKPPPKKPTCQMVSELDVVGGL
jgi:hypothetical protein